MRLSPALILLPLLLLAPGAAEARLPPLAGQPPVASPPYRESWRYTCDVEQRLAGGPAGSCPAPSLGSIHSKIRILYRQCGHDRRSRVLPVPAWRFRAPGPARKRPGGGALRGFLRVFPLMTDFDPFRLC